MDTINKDAAAGAVWNHRTYQGRGIGLDQEIGVEVRGFPVPDPDSGLTPSI
jgi:hypothetical protein